MIVILNQTLICSNSSNSKLGAGIASTYRKVGDAAKGEGTCPSGCAMLEKGCYAKKSYTGMNAHRALSRYDAMDKLIEAGATMGRINVSGDLFMQAPDGYGYCLDVLYVLNIIAWCNKHPKFTAWLYTHDVSALIDAGFAPCFQSFPKNLHIIASVDSLEKRELAKAHGYRTARVILNEQDKVQGETFCPFDLAKHRNKKPDITCVTCKLCFNPAHKHDIAFMLQRPKGPAKGSRTKAVALAE